MDAYVEEAEGTEQTRHPRILPIWSHSVSPPFRLFYAVAAYQVCECVGVRASVCLCTYVHTGVFIKLELPRTFRRIVCHFVGPVNEVRTRKANLGLVITRFSSYCSTSGWGCCASLKCCSCKRYMGVEQLSRLCIGSFYRCLHEHPLPKVVSVRRHMRRLR